MKLFLIISLFTLHLVSNYQNSRIRLITPPEILEYEFPKKLPIQFIRDDEVIDNKFKIKNLNFLWNVELGVKFINNMYLEISDKLSDITILRQIEFYSQDYISPYIRLNFMDLEIKEEYNLFFRNSLEVNYINYNRQTPFFTDTGYFPYNRSYDIGTDLDSLSIFWKASFLYKIFFFSGGIYFGAGMNVLDGKVSYLRYAPSDISSSISNNLGAFGDGKILELGETIILNTTASILTKYGATINFDFSYINLAFGIDYGITSEANIYWINRYYFMELSYKY